MAREKWLYHFRKGLKLYIIGNLPDASDEFEKALKLNSGNSNCNLWVGKCMAEFESYDGAMERFDVAIKLCPTNHLAYFEKGDMLAMMGRLDEALAEMGKAIALDPENADYHYYKALVLLAMGRHDVALIEIDNALKICDAPYLHFTRAEALIQLKRIKEAEKENRLVKDVERIGWKKHPLRYSGYVEIMRGFELGKLV